MRIGKVIGTVWATRKDSSLNGYKLMVVQPINLTDMGEKIAPFIAADIIGAGINETVICVSGSGARRITGENNLAIDTAIVGIVDGCDINSQAK